MQIGSNRRAVAVDTNGPALGTVADEIADGEVGVEWKIGADEGEAPCRNACEVTIAPVGGAQHSAMRLASA